MGNMFFCYTLPAFFTHGLAKRRGLPHALAMYPVCATYGECFRQDSVTGVIQRRDPVTKQVEAAGARPLDQLLPGFGVPAGQTTSSASSTAVAPITDASVGAGLSAETWAALSSFSGS